MGNPFGSWMHGDSRRRIRLCNWFLLLVPFLIVAADNDKLNPFNHPLKAAPHSKTIFYGGTFDLFCIIDRSKNESNGLKSSDIKIVNARDDIILQYKRENINETVVVFHLKNLRRGVNHIYCSLQADFMVRPYLEGLLVTVGDLPTTVSQVNCTLPQWKEFTCIWQVPYNDIPTKYLATVQYPARNGRLPKVCKITTNDMTARCLLDYENFRASYQYSFFKITGTNVLGTTISNFTIDQFRNTIPPPPGYLRSGPTKSVNSFTVMFNLTKDSMAFPPGHKIDVEYCSELNKTWTTVDTSSVLIKRQQTVTYELTNLPYAGTLYDVRVYLRSATGSLRSPCANGIFSTLSSIPSVPPLTTPGIFEFQHRNEITVFWRQLEGYQMNSPTVSYEIHCFDSVGNACFSNVTKTQLTFAKFDLLPDDQYTFHIFSVNEMGSSVNYSEVHVPRYQTVQPIIPVLMDQTNGTFSVSWPKRNDISYYTIFYCEENRKEKVPGFCQGPLKWEIVQGNNKTVHVDSDNPHIFGLSVLNFASETSGIFWGTCTIRRKTGDHTVRSFSTLEKHSRYAFLEWTLGCLAENQLKGFVITYCKAYNNEQKTTCIGEQKAINISDPAQTKYNLTNLLPYSTYKVDIAIVLEESGKLGIQKSIDVSTNEDIPDPPRDLTAVYVDHDSAIFHWELPSHANGVLHNYVLTIMSQDVYKKTTIPTRNLNVTSFNLTGLRSSTTYYFELQVCNAKQHCSNATKTVARTNAYYPDKMEGLGVIVLNQTIAKLTWNPPRGIEPTSCYYEVQLKKLPQIMIKEFMCAEYEGYVNIGELCLENVDQISYSIRAVNEDSISKFAGTFSDDQQLPCVLLSRTAIYITILIFSFMALLVCIAASFTFLLRRKYIKCEPLKPAVDIVMPGGLSPNSLEMWPPVRISEVPVHDTRALLNENTPLNDSDICEEELESMAIAELPDMTMNDRIIEKDGDVIKQQDIFCALNLVSGGHVHINSHILNQEEEKNNSGIDTNGVLTSSLEIFTTAPSISLNPSASAAMKKGACAIKTESAYVTSLPSITHNSSASVSPIKVSSGYVQQDFIEKESAYFKDPSNMPSYNEPAIQETSLFAPIQKPSTSARVECPTKPELVNILENNLDSSSMESYDADELTKLNKEFIDNVSPPNASNYVQHSAESVFAPIPKSSSSARLENPTKPELMNILENYLEPSSMENYGKDVISQLNECIENESTPKTTNYVQHTAFAALK